MNISEQSMAKFLDELSSARHALLDLYDSMSKDNHVGPHSPRGENCPACAKQRAAWVRCDLAVKTAREALKVK